MSNDASLYCEHGIFFKAYCADCVVDRRTTERDAALALVEQMREALGINTSWPISDVIDKLVEAARILLIEKDYDGHRHEEIQTCMLRGNDDAQAIRKALFLTPSSALALHAARVAAEARKPLTDLLKRIQADYDHPWPAELEDELTTMHRLNIFHAISAALTENQGAKP